MVVGTKSSRLMLFQHQQEGFWDLPSQTGSIEFRYAHSSPILCVDFDSPNGFLLASGDTAGTLAVWNLFNGDLLARTKKTHEKGISCVMCIGSNHVVTAGFDKMIRLYRLERAATLKQEGSSSSLDRLKAKKPSFWKRLMGKKEVKALPLSQLTLMKEFRGHKGEIYCMKTIYKHQMFATGATDRLIKVCDKS
jgi:WD40 repeat protein